MEGVTLADLDQQILASWCQSQPPIEPAEGTSPTQALLEEHAFMRDGTLTKGAVLLFAKDPTRWIPCAQVHVSQFKDVVRRGETVSVCIRDTILTGPLPRLLPLVEAAIGDFSGEMTFLDTDGGFKTVREYPRHAWIDGFLGAIMHRSYRSDSYVHMTINQGHLQILSPGTPSDDACHERVSNSDPRNPRISQAMGDMGLTMESITAETSLQDRMTALAHPVFEDLDVLDGASVALTVQSNVEAWNQLLDENRVDGRLLLSPIYNL